jgi:hypothetical protein
MHNFRDTQKANTVFYNGCVFDSLLGLKYALSVEQSHAGPRDGIVRTVLLPALVP